MHAYKNTHTHTHTHARMRACVRRAWLACPLLSGNPTQKPHTLTHDSEAPPARYGLDLAFCQGLGDDGLHLAPEEPGPLRPLGARPGEHGLDGTFQLRLLVLLVLICYQQICGVWPVHSRVPQKIVHLPTTAQSGAPHAPPHC